MTINDTTFNTTGSSSSSSNYSDEQEQQQYAWFLILNGILLLCTTLVVASMYEGEPLHQLGKRPLRQHRNNSNSSNSNKCNNKVGGVYTYLYYSMIDHVGVIGYDPIQGALSPLLRLLCHYSCILILWGICYHQYNYFYSYYDYYFINHETFTVSNSTSSTNPTFYIIGILVIILYTLYFYYLYTILPGVSVPSGPREHKIQRIPKWDNICTTIPKIATTTTTTTTSSSKQQQQQCYTYSTAMESHRITEQVFAGTCGSITGEPNGRDIWTTTSLSSLLSSSNITQHKQKQTVNEELVQLLASGGRTYNGFNPSLNPNSGDRILREQLIREYLSQPGNVAPSLDTTKSNNNNMDKKRLDISLIRTATKKAVHFYSMLQSSDGHWSGDYGGPHFLLPGLIVVWYCMGRPKNMISESDQLYMIHYISVHQQSDGGWGTHIESPSTMFGTTLMYVALRCLGVSETHPTCQKGKIFLHDNGGAIMTASWAKFYLCLLGVMHWDGHNSVPPEMWLLPHWFPFHPCRLWCHCRMVYLPMGYLYGSRYVYEKAESDPLIKALREELYCEPYDNIEWDKTRHMVAPMDNYSPIPLVMRIAQNCLACYENWSIFQPFKNAVRRRGLAFCVDYMAAEDLQTNFIDIGPVNKVLNMMSAYIHAQNDLSHPTVVNHMMRVADYLWVAEDGMKMKGYNGSQCWDTSFAIQAIYEAGLLDEFPTVSKKVWSYLERCQILSTEISQSTPAYKYESAEYRRKYFRHISEGGWPFSTSAHGWPISDCTGEGLKGVLCLLKSQTIKDGLAEGKLNLISVERLHKAADVLLSYQNEDGGFATYENNRGFGWYESLNPSEVFGDIMIDYSYVECSMASLTGLVEFHENYPNYRTEEIMCSIANGRTFLRSLQRDDGSWYGNWACCFCYGGWFGIEGLIKCGEPRNSPVILNACNYLVQHQRPNGGWGEDFTSCYDKEYAQEGMKAYGDDGSGVVNTAWALLALSAAQYSDVTAIKRGVHYLLKRQLPCGDWPQEGIAGVFNRACGITYTAYRNVFPIWALGRCMATYGELLNDKA